MIAEHSLQLAGLFDFLEDVLVWVKDKGGRYRWVNRAFLLNYSLAQPQAGWAGNLQSLIGKTDYELSPVFLADQFRLDDEEVLSGNRIINRIELVGQPDGAVSWNVTNKIPLYDSKGAIMGTAGLTRRLKETEEELLTELDFGHVLAYMRDHYHETITNAHLAQLAHMSLRAFERKFSRSFHLTPQKYLRKLRLQIASRALIYSDRPLADVAVSCGFADQSHFTREFRRLFGRTPRDYRKHYVPAEGDAASGQDSAAPAL